MLELEVASLEKKVRHQEDLTQETLNSWVFFVCLFSFLSLGIVNLVCHPKGLVVFSLFIRSYIRNLLNMSLGYL